MTKAALKKLELESALCTNDIEVLETACNNTLQAITLFKTIREHLTEECSSEIQDSEMFVTQLGRLSDAEGAIRAIKMWIQTTIAVRVSRRDTLDKKHDLGLYCEDDDLDICLDEEDNK